MNLIVFAHRNEAFAFLKAKKWQSLSLAGKTYFRTESELLCICGEGRENAQFWTASLCSKYPVEQIYNFGSCAALDRKLQLEQIHSVKTSIANKGQKEMEFKTFSLQQSDGLVCMSAQERVQSRELADFYESFAQLCDRELWGIAFAAKQISIPLRAYKYVSDFADSPLCFEIREHAKELSSKFLEVYESKDVEVSSVEPLKLPENFHFSQHQKQEFEKRIRDLKIKFQCSEQEVLEKLGCKELAAQAIHKKEKSKILLKRMHTAFDPFHAQLQEKIESEFHSKPPSIRKIQWDSNFEDKNYEFTLQAKSKEEFQEALQYLNSIDFGRLEKYFQGEWDENQ